MGSDANGDALTYSATGLPTRLSVGASSGLIAGTPSVVGTYNVTVSVSDGSLSASRTFSWTVSAGSSGPGTLRLVWDAVPDSRVIGYKVYVGTQPGVYSQTFDVGLTTAWTFPSPVAGQQYCFAVSAYIAGNIEGPKSSEVCGYSNQVPTLASVANQTTNLGQAVTLQLAGTDPDGMTLTYSATGLPTGLSVAPSTGLISGTPTTAGVSSVTASVSDGVLTASRTFTWTIAAADTTVPVVTITSPTTGTAFTTSAASLTLAGTTSDNIAITQVSWANNRGGSGTATGTTSWTATVALQSGVNVVTVTARDAAGNSATDTVTVTFNVAPTLASVANQVTVEGQASSLQLSGADADGDTLTYGANGLPPGLALAVSIGLIAGTPTTAGTYPVTVTVSDAAQTATRSFTWTVTPETVPPVVAITSPTSAATFNTSSATLMLAGTASDNVAVTQVNWANNRGGSGTASGTTSWSAVIALQSGSNILTVTGRDAAGNTATKTLTVTLNVAPTLASVANQSTVEGQAASLQLSGADADGDGLTYGGNGLPPGLAIAVSTGLIAGTPTAVGTYPVTVTASDGTQTASRTFTWTVTPETVAPVVTITSPTTAATFSTSSASVTLAGTASDNVGVSRVTWTNDRGGSGTATGTTTWSVSGVVLQPGINVLSVTASDAAGNTSSDILTVTYNEPLRVGSLTANRAAPQPLGTSVTFTALGAGGTAPYQYQWRVYNGSKWVTRQAWSSNNQFVWTPGTANGAYKVRVVVRGATSNTTASATMDFPIVP